MSHTTKARIATASAAALLAATTGAAIAGSAASAAPAGGLVLLTINGNLHTINGDGTGLRQLTSGGSISDARYSPDGRRIAYAKNVRGTPTIFVMPASGGASTRLYAGNNPSWSPDGTKLAFGREVGYDEHIYVAAAVPGASARRILTGNADGEGGCYYLGYRDPNWSPTGSSIAVTRVCDDDHFQYDTVLARPTGGLIAGKIWSGHQAEFNSSGTTLVASTWDWAMPGQDIFKVPLTSTTMTFLTDARGGTEFSDPVWSPDNGRVAARRVSGTSDDAVTFRSTNGSDARILLRGSATRRITPRDWKAN